MSKPGALDLDAMLDGIATPGVVLPDFDLSASQLSVPGPPREKDLFAPHKRNKWKGVDTQEARCDFAPDRMRITNRGGVTFISLWKKSPYGRTLSEIKEDEEMVAYFADNLAPLIRAVLGSYLDQRDYAVVTTPKRRHTQRNFATLTAARIAGLLALPFFEDCAMAPIKHRVGTIFTPNNIPPQRNVIVFDDFVTTGQTLVSMQNLLMGLKKNAVFFAGINNKL